MLPERNNRLLGEDIHRVLSPEIAHVEARHETEIGAALERLNGDVDTSNAIWLAFVGYAADMAETAFLKGLEFGANPAAMFQARAVEAVSILELPLFSSLTNQ